MNENAPLSPSARYISIIIATALGHVSAIHDLINLTIKGRAIIDIVRRDDALDFSNMEYSPGCLQ